MSMCDDSVTDDATIFVLGLILISIAISSLIYNYYFLKILLSSGGHLPQTVKILLVSCTGAYCFKSFYLSIHGTYLMVIFFVGLSPLSVTRQTCIIVESVYGTCSMNGLITLCVIATDRLLVTKFDNIDLASRFFPIGPKMKLTLVIILVWLLSIIFYTLFVTVDAPVGSSTVCFCYYMAVASSSGSTIRTSSIAVLQVVVITFYAFVLKVNSKVRNELWADQVDANRNNLNSRFTKWANLKATKMLLPVSMYHAIIFIISLVIFDPLKRHYASNNVSSGYITSMSLSHILMAVDILFHPVLCLKYSPALFTIFRNKHTLLVKILECLHYSSPEVDTTPTSTQSVPVQSLSDNVSKAKLGSKAIIEYRIDAETQQETLCQAWEKQLTIKRSKKT